MEMKCGLDNLKQQKIAQLKHQNATLQQQIDDLLSIHNDQSEKQKESNVGNANILMQIEVEEMREKVLKMSVQSLEKQGWEIESESQNFKQQLNGVLKINKELNLKLYEAQTQKEHNDSMLERLKSELKMYQNGSGNGNSMMKTCESLKKNHECLLRTLKVFENKLESHKKYISILQRKRQKQQKVKQTQSQNKNSQNILNRAKSSNAYKSSLWKEEKNNEEMDKKAQQVDRKKVKQFDDLTRKKNQILMRIKK